MTTHKDMSFFKLGLTLQLDRTEASGAPAERQRGPHDADHALILIGAIMSAIDHYFKVRAGPSGVVCRELKESLPWPLHNLHKSG